MKNYIMIEGGKCGENYWRIIFIRFEHQRRM